MKGDPFVGVISKYLARLSHSPQDEHEHRHLGDGHEQGHEEEQDHEGEDHLALVVTSSGRGNRHHRYVLLMFVSGI